jgi:hypothetical protein
LPEFKNCPPGPNTNAALYAASFIDNNMNYATILQGSIIILFSISTLNSCRWMVPHLQSRPVAERVAVVVAIAIDVNFGRAQH